MRGKGVALRNDLLVDEKGRPDPRPAMDWMRAAGCTWCVPQRLDVDVVHALVLRGFEPYPGGPPASWETSTWRAQLRKIDKLLASMHCRGLVVNAEKTWANATTGEREQLRDALRPYLQHGYTVGFATFHGLRGFALWLAKQLEDEGELVGMPETYDYQRGAAMRVRSTCDVWRGYKFRRIVPHVGSLPTGGRKMLRAAFVKYFRKLPSELAPEIDSACVWYALPAPRGALLDAVNGWRFT